MRALALLAVLALAAGVPARAAVPQRIISLMPSLTEDLFAIGAGPAIVGVSAFTDYPPAARRLPVVAGFASADAEQIVRLRPDLVIGIAQQASAVAGLRRTGIRTILLHDDGYADIFRDIEELGRLTGRLADARALNERLRTRTALLQRGVRAHGRTPRVFVVLGVEPIFTVGQRSYIATLIRLAGGADAARIAVPYGAFSPEALLALQPDVLVVDPTVGLQAVLERPPWNGLRAVRERHIAYLPDAAILERPGPRYNDGLAWLIALLNSTRV